MTKRVAVVFGGRSPEHDVSVKTGLQALNALDQRLYDGFPVYIGLDGAWWVGDDLRNDGNYIPTPAMLERLSRVELETTSGKLGGRLIDRTKRGLLSKPRVVEFDIALLALHGLNGEDGRLQGVLETAIVPYTGMRLLPSALLMDKVATKRALAGTGIPLLPYATVDRPNRGLIPSASEIEARLGDLLFPLIVKPTHLGSSIGVSRVTTMDELRAALPSIFQFDTQALVEPCVANLVEYNIAVTSIGGKIKTSAIERPKSSGELLDFKTKYLSGASREGGIKSAAISQGMLSLVTDINPGLPAGAETNIRHWASTCFAVAGGSGAPRIDFLSDEKTGEIWLNEVNPCPGSLAFYLWEAAPEPISFPDLLSHLIDEGQRLRDQIELPADPTPVDGRLFKRP